MSLTRRVRSGAVLQIAARVFSSTVTFVVAGFLLARTMTEREYGIFNFYMTLFMLAMSLVDFGANRAAIRMITAGEAPRGEALRAAITFKAAVGVGAFVVIAAIAVVSEPGLWPRLLFVLAAAHTIFHGFGGASVGYEVDVDYRVPATSVMAGYTVFLAGGLLLLHYDVKDSPPYLLVFGLALATQNTVLYLRARHRDAIVRKAPRAVMVKLVKEALPLGISAAAVAIYFYIPTVLLRPLRGPEDVARFQVAYKLMSFGTMAPVLFSQVLFPVFVRCHGASADALRKVLQRSSFYLALGAAIAGSILFGLAGDLLALVYGEPYRGSERTLEILALAMLCIFLTFPHTTSLIASGNAAVFTRLTAIAAALNVGLNLLLVRPFGPEGAAVTTLVTEVFVMLGGIAFLRRKTGVHGLSRLLLGPLLLFAVIVLVLKGPLAAAPLWQTLPAALAIAAVGVFVLKALPFRLGVEEHLQ